MQGGGLLMTGNEGLLSHPLSKIRRHNHYGHLYPPLNVKVFNQHTLHVHVTNDSAL